MSDIGEDVYTAPKAAQPGLSTSAKRDTGFSVASRAVFDPRKFPFDTSGPGDSLSVWSATKADRMSPQAAGLKFSQVLRMFAIERLEPRICMAFLDALLFSLAVNSSSVLTPDRAEFHIEGKQFRLLDVIQYLGPDLRRFYRAYANETVVILKRVLDHPDKFNPAIQDKRDLIYSVALDRGLTRFPHLIADNADACTDLAVVEHVAIRNSKKSKLEEVINVADRLKTGTAPKTIGNFDSTNAEFLSTP